MIGDGWCMSEPMFYVVTGTGDIVDEINDGDRIVRKASTESFINTIEINMNQDFIKVYTARLMDVASELNGPESAMMMMLIGFIQYNTGILTHRNGKPVTRECVVRLVEKDIVTVDKLLDSLNKKQVIGKHKTGRTVCFTVNPFIFMKGNRVNKTLAKFFENSRWAKQS
jgi:hypothetical protein